MPENKAFGSFQLPACHLDLRGINAGLSVATFRYWAFGIKRNSQIGMNYSKNKELPNSELGTRDPLGV